ncbi:hypothetical protein ASZ90_002277 [hydrocarbon metagenome]|uniref:ATP-grasp domain-containing protein n=1 Tax=hydrocarbon metagenome TaxID=938273 RepID=A0A0W8G450_9ZZZZ
MGNADDGVFPHELALDPQVWYFLYVGEARHDSLNQFMREALERRTGRRMDYIRIIPDVSGCSLHHNTIVVNPRAKRHLARTGIMSCCPMSPREFAATVSASETVRGLVRSLVRRQGEVYMHVAESVPELTLGRLPGVKFIGPDGETAAMWNNRLYQSRMLRDLVPVLDHRQCRADEEIGEVVAALLPAWGDGVGVLTDASNNVDDPFVVTDPRDVAAHPGEGGEAFLFRHVQAAHDPTVLGVTAGEDEVFIAAVADRRQEADGGWGASYPSVLPAHIVRELREHARTAGRVLGGSGYRGVFGCDFAVDREGTVHFVEVNARKHGAALEMCCTLESALPAGAPTLADLELGAVFEGRLPENARELSRALKGLFWRTCTVRADRTLRGDVAPAAHADVRALFRRILSRGADHGMILLEHPAGGCQVEKGAVLGRVVAVATDPAFLPEDMELGRALLLASFQEPAGGE